MKNIVLLAAAGLILLSACSKDTDPVDVKPEPELGEKKTRFSYLKTEVIDFKAYKGTKEGGIDVTAVSTPALFWNATKLKDGYYDSLTVTNDSIYELPNKYEKNNFRFKTSNDTIYQWNRYADFWQLYGIAKKDTIEHYMCFYNFQKSTPPYLYAENGHDDGIVDAKRYFNDNKYFFKNLQAMMHPNDVIAWYNIKYVYARKK